MSDFLFEIGDRVKLTSIHAERNGELATVVGPLSNDYKRKDGSRYGEPRYLIQRDTDGGARVVCKPELMSLEHRPIRNADGDILLELEMDGEMLVQDGRPVAPRSAQARNWFRRLFG